MMNTDADKIDLLIRSLDWELTPAEAGRLQEALESSAALRLEKDRLQRMRQKIGALSLRGEPSFADRVMARIGRNGKPAMDAIIASLFPKAAAACLLIFLAGLLFIYFSSGVLSLEAIIGVQELTPEDASLYLSAR